MLPNNYLGVVASNTENTEAMIFITLVFWKVAFRDDDTVNQDGVFYKVLVGCSTGNILNNNNNSYSKLQKLFGSHFFYSEV